MAEVREIVRRLMPNGTRGTESWDEYPAWPPDLFAVTASLLNHSGYYASGRCASRGTAGALFTPDCRARIARLAKWWRGGGRGRKQGKELQALWKVVADSTANAALPDPKKVDWLDAAAQLLSIADEASAGIGFVPSKPEYQLAWYIYAQYRDLATKGRCNHPFLPHSLCWWAYPSEVVVQPKATTPEVGCTLRSLSHNLALLPSAGEVATQWWLGAALDDDNEKPLNLLVVPYPYRLHGEFVGPFPCNVPGADERRHRFFEMRNNWRPRGGAARLAAFLVELVRQARDEVGSVHAIVLPEGVVSTDDAERIANRLARESEMEFFIGGASKKGKKSGFTRNVIYGSIFQRGRVHTSWLQSKHHRWRLEGSQIRRYNLGHTLDPAFEWWEAIDISDRECQFHVFRHGASLAALVCEDLARIEPVQNVIRSIGPNLLLALLLDGPQLEKRWPGRYATVLADDPGSAVLTLTSLGMVRRSGIQGSAATVALWKDARNEARELQLPKGAQALVLTVSPSDATGYTLDGRDDGGGTVRLSLSGVHPVSVRNAKRWIDCGIDEW